MLYTSNAQAAGFLTDILDGMAQNCDARWIVKLHPREKTLDAWQAAIDARGLSHVRVVAGTADFYALLSACDIHISFASTTLIESAILGKPNLGLDVPHLADMGGFRAAGAFWPVVAAKAGQRRAHADDRRGAARVAAARAASLCRRLVRPRRSRRRAAGGGGGENDCPQQKTLRVSETLRV